jgi:hypothetical protein
LQEILRPFLLVLEFRNQRLVGHALAAIQRMLANNAVSVEGRRAIIQALQQVGMGVWVCGPVQPGICCCQPCRSRRVGSLQQVWGCWDCVGACWFHTQVSWHPCSVHTHTAPAVNPVATTAMQREATNRH